MAQRGVGEARATYTRCELFAAQKNEMAKRRAGAGKGQRYEGEKEYETEQLKLGMVPTCAYNIRQKFVNASRPRRAPFRLFSPRLSGTKVPRKRERQVRIVSYNGILPARLSLLRAVY